MTAKIVLATSNVGKVKDFQVIFSQSNLESQIIGLESFAPYQAPEENANSFIGNALIKAYHAAKLTGLPSLADDSGICVDALQSAPGIYSSRFAELRNYHNPELNKEQQNIACLLQAMQNFPNPEQRTAHFYCCLAFVRFPDDPEPIVAVGKCFGELTQSIMGDQGHGYDPIFFSHDLQKTFGQATAAEKNSCSHRERAFQDLLQRGFLDYLEQGK